MRIPPKKVWRELYDALFAVYGELRCPLEHATPFQLLVAVMLSAQCTDKRVNLVTPELFRMAPGPREMAALPVEKIEEKVATCGLFHNKSRNLSACAKMLCEKFGGEVPRTMEELLELPGIGRKSANVILGNCFEIPGFPVDTHVLRLLNRMGMVQSDSPGAIEKIACSRMEPEYWTNFSHLLIFHGRQICKAGNPACECCPVGYCKGRKK